MPAETLNNELSAKVLEHIKCSHAAMDAANAELEKSAAARKAVEDRIPEVVERLVTMKRIYPTEREKAAAVLRDPVQAIAFLSNLADPSTGIEQEKGASAPTLGHKVKLGSPSGQSGKDRAWEAALRGG